MKYQRPLALALIGLASVGTARLAEVTGGLTGFRQLEPRTLDIRQRTTPESFQNDPEGLNRESEIVLILFDSLSADQWPYLVPYPRARLAELVEAVSGAGARTIGMDVCAAVDQQAGLIGGDHRGAEIDARDRAARALADAVGQRDDERRAVVAADDAARDDADNARVPALADREGDRRRVAAGGLDLAERGGLDAGLDGAPLGVERVEPVRQLDRHVGVLGSRGRRVSVRLGLPRSSALRLSPAVASGWKAVTTRKAPSH